MAATDKMIESVAATLYPDPKTLQVLTRLSATRTVPVQLRLRDHETVYVATRDQADELERSDRAYEAASAR